MAGSAEVLVRAIGKSMGPSSSPSEQTSVKNVLTMSHGDGQDSYSKNSAPQRRIMDVALQGLNLGLRQVGLPSEDGARVVVADLGCSSGPNTIHIMSHIVDTLKLKLAIDAEFQCYFNDLATNDFNNLFRLLCVEDGRNGVFAAGVPGSFFGRLFPRTSVNVFYSSTSLHWLSKIPDAVLDKNSPAYNRGNICYHNSGLAVATAYKEQASLDLKNFLCAREAELVPGGLLFVAFRGSNSAQVYSHTHSCSSDLNDILTDMISEGLLTEEQRDNLNIPIYHRTIEDIHEAIESCGSSFRLVTAKVQQLEVDPIDVGSGATYREKGIKRAHFFKAILGGLLEASLPKQACTILWQRYEKVAERRISSVPHQGQGPEGPSVCTFCLIKI